MRYRSVLLLIYSIGKVHKSGSKRFRLNSVKLQPAAQEIPILRNDNSLCEELVLALRAGGIVIWNAKHLE